METEKVIGTHLGRFAPYHICHQRVTQGVINKHGVQDSLVLIGSSNKFDQRTPFDFEQRRNMIATVFPEIKILPLPDIDTTKLKFEESTLKDWIKQIKDLEIELRARLKFYGGSQEDLDFLANDFETEVLVDRHAPANDLSASQIREFLLDGNNEAFEVLVNPRIVDQMIRDFQSNMSIILTK